MVDSYPWPSIWRPLENVKISSKNFIVMIKFFSNTRFIKTHSENKIWIRSQEIQEIVIDVKDVTVCDTVTSSKKLNTEHFLKDSVYWFQTFTSAENHMQNKNSRQTICVRYLFGKSLWKTFWNVTHVWIKPITICCVCFIADVPNQSNFDKVQCNFSHECCSSLKMIMGYENMVSDSNLFEDWFVQNISFHKFFIASPIVVRNWIARNWFVQKLAKWFPSFF